MSRTLRAFLVGFMLGEVLPKLMDRAYTVSPEFGNVIAVACFVLLVLVVLLLRIPDRAKTVVDVPSSVGPKDKGSGPGQE